MDQAVDQTLPSRTCSDCGTDTYIAALTCHSCSSKLDECVVTGYPVGPIRRVRCTYCHRLANRDDWNRYVNIFGTCPWCKSSQSEFD